MSRKNKKIQDKERETAAEEVKAEETVAEEAVEETEKISDTEASEDASVTEKTEKKSAGSGKGKRLKHGALSVVFTVIFVAAVVLVNVIFNMVLSRFDIAADLTDKAMYSIDDSTVEYLAGVDDNISIIVTAEETAFENSGYEYLKQVSEITKRFAAANSSFTLKYLDLDENPSFYAKYGNTLTDNSIIVESEKTGRYVIVTSSDYLSPKYYFSGEEISETEFYSMYYSGYSAYLTAEYYAAAERSILSAIMSVTNENPVRVAFLTGYGAGDNSTAFGQMLETNAFIVEALDITTVDRIDADIDFVVIYAPLYDYSNDDINKLDMWLDNGGMYGKNMLYLPSVKADVLSNLCSYIKEWGLSIGGGFVYQDNDLYGYSASPTYQQLFLEESNYSGNVDTVTKKVWSDGMKPITILFEESSIYTTAAIVSSYDGAVVAPFDRAEDWTPSQAEEAGSFVVAAEANKVRYESITPYYSRVFVISGQYFVDDYFLSAPSLSNSDIVLSIFNAASGKDDVQIFITPQVFGYDTFEITGDQKKFMTVIFAVVIPLIVIAAGIAVIIRRKRR